MLVTTTISEGPTVAFERAVRLESPPGVDSQPSSGEVPEAWVRVNRKAYPRLPKIELADAPTTGQFESRTSCRTLTGPVSASQLAGVLGTAARAPHERPDGRPYPTAGARTAVEWYAAVSRLDGLPPGVYHYDAHNHVLDVLDDLDPTAAIAHVLAGQELEPRVPPLLLIASASFPRTHVKYGPRGHRYAYLEAGAAAMAIDLSVGHLGLRSCWIGGFPDQELSDIIGVDYEIERESPVVAVAVG